MEHSTFYNHGRRGVKVTQNQILNKRLKEKIYNRSDGRFDSNKIFEKLKAQGFPCPLGKILSLFLSSKRKKYPLKKQANQKSFIAKISRNKTLCIAVRINFGLAMLPKLKLTVQNFISVW